VRRRRARDLAGQDDTPAFYIGIRDWSGGKKRLGVGMGRRAVEAGGRRDFHDAAEVEHDDAVADLLDRGEIVRDEEDRQRQLLLEVHHEVEDLGLDGDVEG
jgi:hypothetical protein